MSEDDIPVPDFGENAAITALDVAVVDSDLLWRVEHLNACRPLYADDFTVLEEALDRLKHDHDTVVLIGPNYAPEGIARIRGARQRFGRLRFVVVDPGDDPTFADRARAGGADEVVPTAFSTEPIIAAVKAMAARGIEREVTKVAAELHDARLVVVTDAKAGEGATTLAIELALELTSNGSRRVALVEADPTFGDIAMTLGLKPPTNLAEAGGLEFSEDQVARYVIDDEDRHLRAWVPPRAEDELVDLPNPTLIRVLDALAPDCDVIIVDAPFRTLAETDLLGLADHVLLVTTRALAALKNTAVAGRVLDRPPHLGVVLNDTYGIGHHHRERPPDADDVAHAVGLPVVATLPEQQAPFGPTAKHDKAFAKAIAALAERLLDPAAFRR